MAFVLQVRIYVRCKRQRVNITHLKFQRVLTDTLFMLHQLISEGLAAVLSAIEDGLCPYSEGSKVGTLCIFHIIQMTDFTV